MPIHIPKKLKLHDNRLSWLYRGLVMCMCTCLAAWLLIGKQYQQASEGRIEAFMWADSSSSNEGAHDAASTALDAICANTTRFEYCWDAHCSFVAIAFPNITCIPRCEDAATSSKCLLWDEVYIESSDHQSLFLATSVKQSYDKEAGINTTVPSSSAHIVESLHLNTVGAAYKVTKPASSFTDESELYSFHNIATVLLNSDGEVYDVREPGMLSLSYEDIGHMLGDTGETDFLEVVNLYAGPNMLDGAAIAAGPTRRISGLDVFLHVYCTNEPDDDIPVLNSHGVSCSMSLIPTWQSWVFFEKVFATAEVGVSRKRTYFAMRFEIDTASNFSFIDLSQIYAFLISMLVMLKLPGQFMMVFTTKCLGGLSRIYDRAVNEPFDILEEIASAPLSIMAAQTTFAQIADTVAGISEGQFQETLTAALSSHSERLQEAEMQNMARMCFKRLLAQGLSGRDDCTAGPGWLKRVGFSIIEASMSSIGSTTSQQCRRASSISADVYIHAALFTNKLQMRDLVMLFDRDRVPWFLERLFMPSCLRPLWAFAAKAPHQALESHSERDQPPEDQNPVALPPPVAPTDPAESLAPSHRMSVLGKAGASGARSKEVAHATDAEDAWAELNAAEHLPCHDELDDESAAGAALEGGVELEELRKAVGPMFSPICRLLTDLRDQVNRQDRRIAKLEAEVLGQAAVIDALQRHGICTWVPVPGPPAQGTVPVIPASTGASSGVESKWVALHATDQPPALQAATALMPGVRGCTTEGVLRVPPAPAPAIIEMPVAGSSPGKRTETFAGGGRPASAGTEGSSHTQHLSTDFDLADKQAGDLRFAVQSRDRSEGDIGVAALPEAMHDVTPSL